MEKVFWVRCPKCGDKFCVDFSLRRNTQYKLDCPFCRVQFFDTESPEILDP